MLGFLIAGLAIDIAVAGYSIYQANKSAKNLSASFQTTSDVLSDNAMKYYEEAIDSANAYVTSSMDQFINNTTTELNNSISNPIISYAKDIQDANSPFNAHATNTAVSAHKIF